MAKIPAQVEVETATQAASRSRVYQLVANTFSFPTPEVFEEIKTGNMRQQLEGALPGLPYSLTIEGEEGRGVDADFPQFQSQYIGLFEVGGGQGPPCPLYEGHYSAGRTAIMAELLSFYHFFGLRPIQQQPRELPDHLSLELEFMHALAYKEVVASQEGKSPQPYWKAQRDFVEGHLAEFVAAVSDHLRPLKAPFFSDMITLAERFCRSDLAYLGKQVGR